MTDLEITKLCAEAMGLRVMEESADPIYKLWVSPNNRDYSFWYFPLHDDAQAMALVKKFRLNIDENLGVGRSWIVNKDGGPYGEGPDLNRAICECVARMQKSNKEFDQPHYGHDN